MGDEFGFVALLKGLFFLLLFPFRMLFLLIEMMMGSAQHHRFMTEHEERMKSYEDEKQTRLAAPFKSDTAAMEGAAQERIKAANFPNNEEFAGAFYDHVVEACVRRKQLLPVYDARVKILTAALDLYTDEGLTTSLMRRIITNEIDEGRYRDELLSLGRKAENPAATIKLITNTLTDVFFAVSSRLPPFALDTEDESAEAAEHAPTVPLLDAIADPGRIVLDITTPFFAQEVEDAGLFTNVRKQLTQNGDAQKGVMPDEYQGRSREMVDAYLRNTRLARMFDAQVPFDIPLSRRLEHTAIIAGTGHGKTQMLQSIIARDLQQADPPAMVVVDSTGAMIRRIQQLALFNERLAERLIIIDPEDDPVPPLNMFDVSNPRLQTYGRAVREEVESEVIGLFNYVFASLATELTGQQSSAFSYIVRLLLSIPGSNIHTMRELLEDTQQSKTKFAPHIARLDPTTQAFFEHQFYATSFRGTRTSIARRLYALIQVPAFERMFSTVNKLDLFAELQRGAVILINTSTRLLKEEASPLFGRYMIARTLAAIFERAAIPEQERRPAFLIVDEAAPYFDDTFDAMLTRVRQFKLGVVIAFQHLEQTSQKLRSAIASNTSVKLAGGLGYTDSAWLAREMHTTQDFIQGQRRDPHDPPKYTRFACYVRNFTDTAVSLTVPIGTLEAMPIMSPADQKALLARNRSRVSFTAPVDTREPEPVAPQDAPTHEPPAPPRRASPRSSPPSSEAAGEWG